MSASSARRLLIVATAVFVLVALGCAEEDGPVVFTHGVASGDARPNSAVLWTRIDREATLTVEVATDDAFGDILLEQEVEANADRDFTAKVEVAGLEPGTGYYYRFRRGESVSRVGAFRTPPAEGESALVRFVFSGDTDGTVREDGTRAFDFKVLDAARAEDPDFFLYFGDTIYADSPYGPKAETLAAFRDKYKENRDIFRLRDILAATSIYTTWDDHEVENNFAGTTVDPDLLAAGRQAFREYLPIGGDETPEVLYRRFRWGSAVELIILDERSFRDADVEAACTLAGQDTADVLPSLGLPGAPEAFGSFRTVAGLPAETDPACIAALTDPNRTMLGEAQKQFLLQALEDSEATFKFIVNEVPITELAALPYDRWEGYRAERDEILRFIAERQISNVVFLTTDYHANIISDVRVDLDSPPVAVEVVTGPIAHTTLATDIVSLVTQFIDVSPDEAMGLFETLLDLVPQVDCVAAGAFSYGLVEVDPVAATATITLKDEDDRELCRTVIEAE